MPGNKSGLNRNMEINLSNHARRQAERRGIPEDVLMDVARNPQQLLDSIEGRKICQSKMIDPGSGKEMLLRLVVKDINDIRFIVTVYKTSKIEKYWEVDE